MYHYTLLIDFRLDMGCITPEFYSTFIKKYDVTVLALGDNPNTLMVFGSEERLTQESLQSELRSINIISFLETPIP